MNVDFTIAPQSYQREWMAKTIDALKRAFIPVISKSEATPRVLMQSPSGKVWSVTVSDAGAITVTAWQRTDPP